jgi:hypothetical protein
VSCAFAALRGPPNKPDRPDSSAIGFTADLLTPAAGVLLRSCACIADVVAVAGVVWGDVPELGFFNLAGVAVFSEEVRYVLSCYTELL